MDELGNFFGDLEDAPDSEDDEKHEFLDTELLSVGLRAFVDCEQCATKIPVNQMGSVVHCSGCGHVQNTGASFWKKVLKRYRLSQLLVDGEELDLEEKHHSLKARLRHPTCGACNKALPDELLLTAAGESLLCPNCHETVACRAPTAAALVLPGAAALIGEEPEPSAPAKQAPPPRPVTYQCVQCGGALSVDGSERRVRCTYCESDNFLPDSLWKELHPQPKVQEIFVVVRPTVLDRWQVLLEDHSKLVAKLIRESESLPEGTVDLCLRASKDHLLAALASRRDTSEKILSELARRSKAAATETTKRKDVSPQLLSEIAGQSTKMSWRAASSPNLPAAKLAEMAQSLRPDDEKLKRWKILAINPSTPISSLADSMLATFGGDLTVFRSDPQIQNQLRAIVAARPDIGDLPEPSLRAMVRYGDSKVALAFVKNQQAPGLVIRSLSLHFNPEVRQYAAAHPRTARPGLRDRWNHFIGPTKRGQILQYGICFFFVIPGVLMLFPGVGVIIPGIPPVFAESVGKAVCPADKPPEVRFAKVSRGAWYVQCGSDSDAKQVSGWLVYAAHLPLAALLSLLGCVAVFGFMMRRQRRRLG